jgi:hypothetical protein
MIIRVSRGARNVDFDHLDPVEIDGSLRRQPESIPGILHEGALALE